VLTENDVLQALVDNAPGHLSIAQWIRGGHARLPGFMVPSLTVPADTTLAEAAMSMTCMAEEGGFACHHLVVRIGGSQEDEPPGREQNLRVLSALDVARGMLDAAALAEPAGGESGRASAVTAALKVSQVMKSRAIVPTCQLSDNLTDAFRMLLDKRQNCAVVVSGGSCMELESNTEHPQNRVTAASAATAEKQAKGSQEESVIDDLSPVYGIITTADALRAFLEYHTGVRSNLASWIRGIQASPGEAPKRSIPGDASLAAAAQAMATAGVHHLLVLEPRSSAVIGVVSALDVVHAVSSCYMTGTGEWDLSTEMLYRGGSAFGIW
ncbi:unnamed protein product, partial [Polarella glacialis]